MPLSRRRFLGICAGAAASVAFPALRLARGAETPLRNVILLMQENRSFDHYFGLYPGADGIPRCAPLQHATTLTLGDPPHLTEAAVAEYDQGRNDQFELVGGTRTLTYYTGEDLPYYWALAHRFTLCDRYFCSVLGPTVPNRIASIAASPGGFVDNPTGPDIDASLLPRPTVVDRLDEAGVSWACYGDDGRIGGFNPILLYPERRTDPRLRRAYADFLDDAAGGRLPAVSWVITRNALSEHPPAPVTWGERFAALTINSVAAGPQWGHAAVVLNYDENGGFYDHVPPPQVGDRGYGFRVPAIIASPFAKPGHVSSSTYDHSSVIALLERVFGLRTLGRRDESADPLMDAFDFDHAEPGFVSYTAGSRLADSSPLIAAGESLLTTPVPSGSGPVIPAARILCPPQFDLTGAAAAGVGAGLAAAAAGYSRRLRPRPRIRGSPGDS